MSSSSPAACCSSSGSSSTYCNRSPGSEPDIDIRRRQYAAATQKLPPVIRREFSGKKKKHETGFEPATLALARRYSTTEPLVRMSCFPQAQCGLYTIRGCLSTSFFHFSKNDYFAVTGPLFRPGNRNGATVFHAVAPVVSCVMSVSLSVCGNPQLPVPCCVSDPRSGRCRPQA